MFKKFSVFTYSAAQPTNAPDLRLQSIADALGAQPFRPCEPRESLSSGWVPPRGDHEAMVEAIGGQLIAKFMVESKSVPARELAKWVDAAAGKIEATTGRKPGRKERRELKEDALDALLPQAFPRAQAAFVWFDRQNGRIVIGSTSQGVIDLVLSLLARLIDGLSIGFLNTKTTPATFMTGLLLADPPTGDFGLGGECVLKADDESKAMVRYKNHSLHTDEVQAHIHQGKRPNRLALSYLDRVSFALRESGAVEGVQMLDAVEMQDKAEDAFDADVAIWTGEVGRLIDALVADMGGLYDWKEGGENAS